MISIIKKSTPHKSIKKIGILYEKLSFKFARHVCTWLWPIPINLVQFSVLINLAYKFYIFLRLFLAIEYPKMCTVWLWTIFLVYIFGVYSGYLTCRGWRSRRGRSNASNSFWPYNVYIMRCDDDNIINRKRKRPTLKFVSPFRQSSLQRLASCPFYALFISLCAFQAVIIIIICIVTRNSHPSVVIIFA